LPIAGSVRRSGWRTTFNGDRVARAEVCFGWASAILASAEQPYDEQDPGDRDRDDQQQDEDFERTDAEALPAAWPAESLRCRPPAEA
jgi:hypothetical protein